jgi:hypothetical protein
MAQTFRDTAQEDYVAGTPDSLLTFSDYLYEYKGVPKLKDVMPFFIEIVKSDGVTPTTIPFPPDASGPNREILGIRLMINPASVSVNLAKIINRTQSMVGWIEDHWGEEIDTVTLQGSSAAFVIGSPSLAQAGRAAVSQAADPYKADARADFYSYMGVTEYNLITHTTRRMLETEPGLTVAQRRTTMSYREFKRLIEIFATNGCIFDNQGFVQERRYIRISYDYASYLGYFESIDLNEDANTPFRFTYTITFKSERTAYKFVSRRTQ